MIQHIIRPAPNRSQPSRSSGTTAKSIWLDGGLGAASALQRALNDLIQIVANGERREAPEKTQSID